jgi:DNA repair exonuclease SbcCD ATPase subunit
MVPIRQITIGGFRGILCPLPLQFVKGKTSRSMVIYGRNGTGKSSITDAWEWFHAEKIGHLAREGAGPSSFPHRNAKSAETFVEVQFESDELGRIRLNFDFSRVTMPVPEGNIAKFRSLAPHPCHIRFEDLTRFVYLTKTEKYDALAQLMGFTPQVEFQKALRRVLRQLSDELETSKQNVGRLESNLSALLKLDMVDEKSILKSLSEILTRYSIEPATSIEGLQATAKVLTETVENDPRSQELADLATLKKAIERLKLPDDLEGNLQSYVGLAEAFKQEEKTTVDLLLIGLYEQGENVLTTRMELGEEIKNCPLCGQPFEGDLLEHISSELSGLRDLKKSRDELENTRKQTLRLLASLSDLSKRLREDCQEIKTIAQTWPVDLLAAQAEKLESALNTFARSLGVPPERLETTTVGAMREALKTLALDVVQLGTTRENLLGQVVQRVETLQKDTSRAQLVADHTTMLTALSQWAELGTARKQLACLREIHESFQVVVEDYVQSSIDNVQRRFEVISSDVQTYFEILEEHTEGLGHPALKLLTDQDRAVVLQVVFHGEPIYPAYRYLSESQLNSFGLAVFLASAKYFNQNFKFLILDDVINSFDGYKRPQVIKLLKQEFSDHQILLMTHDMVWRDRLFEACPSWVKCRFVRLEPGIGPIVMEGVTPLAAIEQLIDEDEPVSAGRNMGPFLERQLQELCESFQVLVQYNQRNEYTLVPLLDRFRVRVKEKLGKNHPLYEAVQALQEEAGFRNLCAHWKDPDIQITSEEMMAVVEGWKAIEELVRCKNENCCGFLQYDEGSKGFVCECGVTRLDKV